MINQLIIISV